MTVAAVQATPVILDAEASVAKAVGLIGEAAAKGAQVVVLPEVFVSLHPSNAWARDASAFAGFDEFWERMWGSAVDVPGPHVDALVAACAEHNVICAIGVNERESSRPGMLSNTLLILGSAGVLHRHRKLMPTHHEGLFHGVGAGDDFPVPLPPGREVFGRGGAAIVEPTSGNVIAGPLYNEEGILLAECDLRRGLHAKRWFDAVGHYSREEVLAPAAAAPGQVAVPAGDGLRANGDPR